jgi:hypothetical protein
MKSLSEEGFRRFDSSRNRKTVKDITFFVNYYSQSASSNLHLTAVKVILGASKKYELE